MKLTLQALAIAAVLVTATMSTAHAVPAPPLPDSTCGWVNDNSIRCTDGFGNRYTCRLSDIFGWVRWSCS